MKVILRADVENLGILGDVVTVKPGYGRNYLLPQGLAMLATEANMHTFELERKKLQARMDAQRAEARSLAEKIEALNIVIPMHVGENDKLYGSVTTTMIGDAILAQGVEVDRRRILLDAPIRRQSAGEGHFRPPARGGRGCRGSRSRGCSRDRSRSRIVFLIHDCLIPPVPVP